MWIETWDLGEKLEADGLMGCWQRSAAQEGEGWDDLQIQLSYTAN